MQLKKGDTLGVIAPASPCDPEFFNLGLAYLHTTGFETRVAIDPAAAWKESKHLFSSDTPEARVNALYQLFEDPKVKAILSVRGGYGAMELLPLIDFERLSKNPKPFVGLSDLTVLLNMISQRTDIPAIRGVVFPKGFAKASIDDEAKKSCDDLFALLGGRREGRWGGLTHLCGAKDGEGTIVGGNLSMLAAVSGTPWEPIYDDQMLFIEDVGERPYQIHRKLFQLKLSGVLDNLKGVIVGEFVNCEKTEPDSPGVPEVLHDIFSSFQYPVVTGAPYGHGNKNLSFRLGAVARIEDGGTSLKIF